MFVTRASRHDRVDLAEFYASQGWETDDLAKGAAYIARDGRIVGSVRLLEVAPQTVIVEDVVVASDRREEGIGRRLMQTAMNSRGGRLYLCCHPEYLGFYGHFGFTEVPFEELPEPVAEYFRSTGDYPTEPGHIHHFLTAR